MTAITGFNLAIALLGVGVCWLALMRFDPPRDDVTGRRYDGKDNDGAKSGPDQVASL